MGAAIVTACCGPGVLRIFTFRDGYRTRASLAGDLDVVAVPCLADWAGRLAARPPHLVQLDISGLLFADVAGTRALAQACSLLRERGGRLELTGACLAVARITRLTGLALTS